MAWTRAPLTRTRFDVEQGCFCADHGLWITLGLHFGKLDSKMEIMHSECTIST